MTDLEFIRSASRLIDRVNWEAFHSSACFEDGDCSVQAPDGADQDVVSALGGFLPSTTDPDWFIHYTEHAPSEYRLPLGNRQAMAAIALRKTLDKMVAADPFFRREDLRDEHLEHWLARKGGLLRLDKQ